MIFVTEATVIQTLVESKCLTAKCLCDAIERKGFPRHRAQVAIQRAIERGAIQVAKGFDLSVAAQEGSGVEGLRSDDAPASIEEAVAAERERCARVAETYDDGIDSVLEFEAAVGSRLAAKSIAAAIRAQGREGGTYGSAPSGRTEPVGDAGSTALPPTYEQQAADINAALRRGAGIGSVIVGDAKP